MENRKLPGDERRVSFYSEYISECAPKKNVIFDENEKVIFTLNIERKFSINFPNMLKS